MEMSSLMTKEGYKSGSGDTNSMGKREVELCKATCFLCLLLLAELLGAGPPCVPESSQGHCSIE